MIVPDLRIETTARILAGSAVRYELHCLEQSLVPRTRL